MSTLTPSIVAEPLVLFGPELETALALDTASEEYRREFLQNVSELIMEGALIRYFTTMDEADQSVFEAWVAIHRHKQNFVTLMRRTHPNFMTILEEEIVAFKKEAFRIGMDDRGE